MGVQFVECVFLESTDGTAEEASTDQEDQVGHGDQEDGERWEIRELSCMYQSEYNKTY